MPFDPTNFVNNQQPAITAAQLNKLGTQYDAVAADVGDPGTEVGAELANAFVRFVDQDGNPLPAGSLTTIVVNTITNDIDDIIFEESS